MIASDGWANTGKTEFAWSSPGPIIHLCLDRGHDAALDNANPPATRSSDVAYDVIKVPMASQAEDFVKYWQEFYDKFRNSINNPDCRTVIVDGDSDSWELQRLAAFGKLDKVPPHKYTEVNAARRALYARAFDSRKVCIFTSKLKEEYETVTNKKGEEIRQKTGKDKRQGFDDHDYLFALQLRHLYKPASREWGVRILRCKADTSVEGYELWNEECNLSTVLQTCYPKVPLQDWGYR